MISNKVEPKIDDKIRNFVRNSGIPLHKFTEAVGWKSQQTLDWWSHHGEKLHESNIESLAQYLGVPADTLVTSSYDLNLIRERILGCPTALPENYSENASSYVRTLVHIVEYLAMLYGRHFTDNLLRSLQIHPLFFSDLNNRINLSFYTDIFTQLSHMGISDEEIASLACYIFLTLRDTEIGRKFRTAKNHQESYAILAEHATAFETNFEYEFQIDPERVRIIARPNDATLELSRISPEGYNKLSEYRKKVFGWFPSLSNMSPLVVTVTQSILRGDPCTVYEASLPEDPSSKDHGLLKLL